MTISSLVLLVAEKKGWVMGTIEFCLRTLSFSAPNKKRNRIKERGMSDRH